MDSWGPFPKSTFFFWVFPRTFENSCNAFLVMFPMDRRTLHTLELGAAIAGQTVLLGIAWGFLGVVFYDDPLVVSDYLANLMNSRPTETTWIATLIATIFSVTMTTWVFIQAVREYSSRWFTFTQLSVSRL